LAEEIHLRWMKSLRDEICLAAGDGGGFRSSEAARLRFHLRRHAEDFIRACEDFIVATPRFHSSFPHRAKTVDRFEPPHCRGRRLDDPKSTVQTIDNYP